MEGPRKNHLPWPYGMSFNMLLAMRKIEGKKQQTYSCGEDKKEKQHKLHMNLWNAYMLVWNTNISRIEFTLG